ncbi:MAG: 6-phosphogluconolactonase [Acidimicrobiia bacterium]|nr:6-phosphogluconolactonase [Acidimicrobiia bacterium]NNK90901.1 6-phosphogluconolactonase [Acidimicrobiia bacterium]
MDIRVYDDRTGLADAAAHLIVDRAAAGTFSLGLAGGSTPRATYERLAEMRADLSGATLWLGDERWVDPDHRDSNARMARESLGTAHGASFVVPDWSLGEPETAAAAYELALDRALEGRPPGLVLLGMGDDGHTASLFPGTRALEVTDRNYVANWVDEKEAWRLTATVPFLASADQVVFLVAGESKAAMVERVIERAEPFPSRVVSDAARDVIWMLDTAAASRLGRPL